MSGCVTPSGVASFVPRSSRDPLESLFWCAVELPVDVGEQLATELGGCLGCEVDGVGGRPRGHDRQGRAGGVVVWGRHGVSLSGCLSVVGG